MKEKKVKIKKQLKQKIKVCIISIEYAPVESGVGVACKRIASNLNDDHEIHILTFGENKDNYLVNKKRVLTTTTEDGITVHRINPYSGNLTKIPPQEIQNACYFLEELHSQHKFDILHGFNLTGSGYIASFMAKKLNLKSVVSIRGNDIGRDIFDLEKLFSIRWVLDNSDKLTFVSNDLLEYANTLTDCRQKSIVIHNTINPFEFFYRNVKLKLDGLVICYSGVVRRKKGFSYLLEAFSKLIENHNATLLIVGEFMAEEKLSYLSMIEDLNLHNNVIITGRIPHNIILNYINICDVFVMPAISEGCSNSMLEAMFCKKAVVATNVGAAPDIIENNKTGLLIKPHSPKSLLETFTKLKNNKKLRDKLGENAKELIIKKYTPEIEKKAWTSLYSELVQSDLTKNNKIQKNNQVKKIEKKTKSNIIKQKSNLIKAKSNIIKQKSNLIKAKSNVIKQKSNLIETKSNVIKQKSNLIKAKSNVIKATNDIIKQKKTFDNKKKPILKKTKSKSKKKI